MATKRASAKMPPLKHALVLAAEVETLKVHVEALRATLVQLTQASEVLLREANPMTSTAQRVAMLVMRASRVLETYASEQVRAYFAAREEDKVLLDYLEACAVCLRRHNDDWFLDVSAGPVVRHQGPLRDILKTAFPEETRCGRPNG